MLLCSTIGEQSFAFLCIALGHIRRHFSYVSASLCITYLLPFGKGTTHGLEPTKCRALIRRGQQRR